MAPVYRLAEVGGKIYTDISSYFRLYQLDVSMNAEEGSVNQSTIQADDPTGVFDIVGTRRLVISDDTASSSNTRIWDGYVAGRRVHRGDSQLTGTARVWDIDLVDINSLLALRVITGTDANRPAETDVARVQWLYGSNENAHITDSLYLNTSGGVAMDAADYRGQRFNQVLDDCAQASGKNYFVWWREEVAKLSLWYDFASSTSYSSPLRLSNVATDVDSVLTFAISEDTQLSRSPDRVNSGAYLPFDGGAVYVQNTATANSFVRRDANMPSENVKSTAKATARANRYLLEMNTEEDVITTTVQLPAAKVNFIMQGMRVQFKAAHLPGYESYVWARVLNRSVQQVSEEFYDVKMELAPAIAGTAGLCAGGTYALTAAGTYPPNNSLTNNGGIFYYLKPGVVYTVVPEPGHLGGFNFYTLGSGGTPDFFDRGWGNSMRAIVVGEGSLTIRTAASGGTSTITLRLRHGPEAGPTTDSTQTGLSGTDFTFAVSSHGGTECVHYVDILDTTPIDGSKIGLVDATWTPS